MPGTRKLGKPTDQRMAMLRQQVTDLMTYGKITTTVTRAKELKPLADKMITLGKRNTLASRLVRLGARRGDAAEEAIIALVDEDKIAAADAEAEKARKEEERAAKKAKKA